MPPLMTVGYARSHSPEAFGRGLITAGVSVLLDVRARPYSGRPGYSGRDLLPVLQGLGLKAVGVPQLGNPDHLRDLWGTDPEAAEQALITHLETRSGRYLERLAELFPTTGVCLMCGCGSHLDCHRGIVADLAIARAGEGAVLHLGPDGALPQ